MAKIIVFVLAAVFSLFLSGCPSNPAMTLPRQAGREVRMSGTYTHQATGVQFPEEFVPYVRVSIHEYDAAGDNVGIGYNLHSFREPTILTVYLYPGPSPSQGRPAAPPDVLLEEHYQEALLTILASHRDPQIISQEPFVLRQAGQTLRGRRAIVRFREDFAGQEQDCSSCLYLFYHNHWFIKYRMTCPAEVYDLAQQYMEQFVLDFPILPSS